VCKFSHSYLSFILIPKIDHVARRLALSSFLDRTFQDIF
jgi:hypothetical protein